MLLVLFQNSRYFLSSYSTSLSFPLLSLKVLPLVLQWLLLQAFPRLPLAHLLHQIILLARLHQHLLNQSASNLGLNHLRHLRTLNHSQSCRRHVLNRLSVHRVLGERRKLLEGCVVHGQQSRARVGVVVETGDTCRSWFTRC